MASNLLLSLSLGIVALIIYDIQGIDACSDVQRMNYWTGETTCCKYVQCKPNFYVKTCEEDHTADTCEPCPRGFFMLQSTDSHFPFPCEKISCPPEARPVSFMSEKGCHIPCECDESRGYMGEDPCLCQKRPPSVILNTISKN
ncbi:uncharacterized protein LOC111136817 [Crassostrea virginica]